jgi:hypothetical protein
MVTWGIDVSLTPRMLRDPACAPGMGVPLEDHAGRIFSQNSLASTSGIFPAASHWQPTAEYDSGADFSWTRGFNGLPMQLDPALQTFPDNGISNGNMEVSGGFPQLECHAPQLALDVGACRSQSLAQVTDFSIPSALGIDTEIWSRGFFPPPPAPYIDTSDAPNFTIQADGDDFNIQENGMQNHLDQIETVADNAFWRYDSVAGSFEPSDKSSSDAFLDGGSLLIPTMLFEEWVQN